MKQTCLILFLAFSSILYSQTNEKFSRNKLDVFYNFIDKNFDKKLIDSNQKIPFLFYIDDDGKSFDLKFTKDNDSLITNELKNIFDKMPYWDMSDQESKFVIKVTVNLFLDKDLKTKGTTQMNWYNKETFVKQKDPYFTNSYGNSNENYNENGPLSFATVEVRPEYPGGINEFYSYISKNFRTPKSKDFKGGKIVVTFVIEKDGSVTDIKFLKNAGFDTDKEAIRVLNNCPKWKPAEQKGKEVRCQFALPITLISN